MSEAAAVIEKAKRAPTEYTDVTMSDGRVVKFAGKRKMQKEVVVEGGRVGVRFDFSNGETRLSFIPEKHFLHAAGHGWSQKIGDETAGTDDVDDMVVGVDEKIAELEAGDWRAARAAGDSFAGASIVIRAIMEAKGLVGAEGSAKVKAFLDRKLAADPKLTRKALNDSFRDPASPTGIIIKRLEDEKRVKNAAFSANALLEEIE